MQALFLLEGFAGWVAYKLAERHHLYRAMVSMRRNAAEPYQTGLHTLLSMEQEISTNGVISYARKQETLKL